MVDASSVSDTKDRTTWLYRSEDNRSTYWVGYEILEDKLVFTDYECGETVKQTWIDSDREHFLTIKRTHVAQFLSQCCDKYEIEHSLQNSVSDEDIRIILTAAYKGQSKIISDVKKILKTSDIPYDFEVW